MESEHPRVSHPLYLSVPVPAGSSVTISSSSIGHVHRGAWDFPLD